MCSPHLFWRKMETAELHARITDLENELEIIHSTNNQLSKENKFLKYVIQREGIDVETYTAD